MLETSFMGILAGILALLIIIGLIGCQKDKKRKEAQGK